MASAFYYHGLTIEFDPGNQRLSVDGQVVPLPRALASKAALPLTRATHAALIAHAKRFVDATWDLSARDAIRDRHVAALKNVEEWGKWRRSDPVTRPLLYGARLNGAHLEHANLANANLINAQLRRAHLDAANLHEANLGGADLTDACLRRANLCRTDLYETVLRRTDLRRANLQGTQLAKTDIRGARMRGCRIYGLSAWDLKPDRRSQQKELIVAYGQERAARMLRNPDENLVVDDLTVAQFIYLLLHNQTIGNTLDSVSRKVVLILGRFTPPRKRVLDGIRQWLRRNSWVPILFDFVRPEQRDFTETVKSLASLSRFIIVDVTNPKSSPLEMQALAPDYAIPIVPIIQRGEKPFSMFDDLKKYPWVVRRLVSYESSAALKAAMKREVVAPALAMARFVSDMRRERFERIEVRSSRARATRRRRSARPR